jgi:hypothetical protein
MSCPDWTALTAHRRNRDGSEPAAWGEALTHLDGCGLCRRQALAADPTLVFRRLTAVPAVTMTESEERSEADAVRAAVAAMRAASRLDSLEAHPRTSSGSSGWRRAAMAAVLALALVAGPAGHDRTPGDAGDADAAIFRDGRVDISDMASQLASQEILPAAAGQADFGEQVVEGVNLPDARVYHMSGEGLSVVMVVDESFDI